MRVSFLGFPTPEQGDKFKTPVAHTRLIKGESPPQALGKTHSPKNKLIRSNSDVMSNQIHFNYFSSFSQRNEA